MVQCNKTKWAYSIMTICAAKTISILIDHRNIIEKTHLTSVKVGVEHSFPIFPEALTNLTTWSDFTNSLTLISTQKGGKKCTRILQSKHPRLLKIWTMNSQFFLEKKVIIIFYQNEQHCDLYSINRT